MCFIILSFWDEVVVNGHNRSPSYRVDFFRPIELIVPATLELIPNDPHLILLCSGKKSDSTLNKAQLMGIGVNILGSLRRLSIIQWTTELSLRLVWESRSLSVWSGLVAAAHGLDWNATLERWHNRWPHSHKVTINLDALRAFSWPQQFIL